MDSRLLKASSDNRPRLNKNICKGLATTQMLEVEREVDLNWRDALGSVPNSLKYEGGGIVTPSEEFAENIRATGTIDVANNDTYLCKYNFGYGGTRFSRYMSLPIINQAGLMTLKDTLYTVSPVIGGAVFNIEPNRLYMWTPRDRIVIESIQTAFLKDGKVKHADAVTVPNIFKAGADSCKTLQTSAVHYIIAKMGISGMFRKYFNLEVKLGGPELKELETDDNWTVYTTRGVAPRGARGKAFRVNDLHIAIPKQEDERVLDGTLGAIMYIVDNASMAVTVEDADKPELWEFVMQRFIFTKPEQVLNCEEKVHRHIHENIAQYINHLTQVILRRNNIHVNGMFDLLDYLNKNFVDIITHTEVNSMYDKELTTMRHVIYPVIEDIYTLAYTLMSLGDDITESRIRDKLHKISPIKLRKEAIKLGVLNTASIANDCYLFGATNIIIPQDKAGQRKKNAKKKKKTTDPSTIIHSSQLEVCSIRAMSKAEPTSRATVNPFLHLIENRLVSPNPKFEDKIGRMDEMFKED